MPSKSKNKGNKFENDIVKAFNQLHKTEEFRRTPNSGAMMGRSNAMKFAGLSESVQRTLSSDIITPDWFPFAIECKHYGDKPNYAALIKENDTTLDRWLGEAIFDAANQNLHPMLCFKTDRKGTHVAIPEYWLQITQVFPSHYVVYDAEFVIMGLQHWEMVGPHYIEYHRNDQETREEIDHHGKHFPNTLGAAKFLKQLEK
jgi:hypothetical protein